MMAADISCADPLSLSLLQKINQETSMTDATSVAPMVSNSSTAEGLDELAEVQNQVLDSKGTVLTPVLVAGVPEYTIGAGQNFTLRTRARDLRSQPLGVFSVFTNTSYTTVGSPNTELVMALWGETQTLHFSQETTGGSFTLRYGSETTVPIQFFPGNYEGTQKSIADAIGALSFVGGKSNIRVYLDYPNYNFTVVFSGSLSRQNLVDPVIDSNNLSPAIGGADQFHISSLFDPTDIYSFSAAVSYPDNLAPQNRVIRYDGVLPEGTLQITNNVGFQIHTNGGIANVLTNFADPSPLYNIFDTSFRASDLTGVVDFSVGGTNNPIVGVGLFDFDTVLTDSQVRYPTPFRIQVVPTAQSMNDSFTILEDSVSNVLNVTANDPLGGASSSTITAITQPNVGSGTTTISTDGQSVLYSPTANFAGPTSFTYTITDNLGASTTATVSLNVTAVNDPPIPDSYSTTVAEDSTTSIAASLVLAGDKTGPDSALDEKSQIVSIVDIARTSTKGGTITPVLSELNITSFTYTPAPNFIGADSFTYTLSDNDPTSPQTSTGTISVTVTELNDELAEIQTQVLNAKGDVLSPTIVSGVPEYRIPAGRQFSIRTQARDLRIVGSTGGVGIFAVYADLNYATIGSPTTELAQVLWGENLVLRFANGTSGGTFALAFGSDTTAPINFSTVLDDTQTAIRNAIAALGFVGGASNLRVSSIGSSPTEGPIFAISFIGNLARTDVPNGVLVNNQLTSDTGGASQVTLSSNADPSNKSVLAAAVTYPKNVTSSSGAFFRYDGGGGFAGNLQTLGTPGYRLNDIGNFANTTGEPPAFGPSKFVSVSDTQFKAANDLGTVEFSIGSTNNSKLGVALFGDQVFLSDRLITYPAPFRIRIDQPINSTAANDSFTVAEDSVSNVLNARQNDLLGDADAFTITSVTQPNSSIGSATITDGGASLSFTPNPNFSGSASIAYTLSDNFGHDSSATATIQVTPVNDEPIPDAFTKSILEDSTATIEAASVLLGDLPGPANALDESAQTVTIVDIQRTTANGGVITPVFNGQNITKLDYKPRANFSGTDTFTYSISDNDPITPLTKTGTITVAIAFVNDPPIPDGFSATIAEDTKTIFNATSVLVGDLPGPQNETEEQTQILTIVDIQRTSANGGVISPIFTGPNITSFDYTPRANFVGKDTFTYTISDNDPTNPLTSIGTITITMTAVNDAPVPDGYDVSILEDTLLVINDVSILTGDLPGPANATDEQGQTITITSVSLVSSRGVGVALVNSGGIVAAIDYNPPANFSGIDTLTYTISDNFGTNPLTTVGTITIRILPVNEPPEFVPGTDVQVLEDAPAYSGRWVPLNDPPSTTPAIAAGPIGAADELDGSQTVRFEVSTSNGSLFAQAPAIDANGILTFLVAPNANGISVVSVTAIDSGSNIAPNVNRSPTSTFTISVTPDNDAPIGVADSYTTTEDETILTPTVKLLSNDSDIEGDVFSVVQGNVTSAAGITVSVNADGSFSYDPTGLALFQTLPTGQSIVDTFTYKLKDVLGAESQPVTVSITVEGRNGVPVATSDTVKVLVGNSVVVDVLSNDTDEEGAASINVNSVTITTQSSNGTATVQSDGKIQFSPKAGFKGTTTVQYTIKDDLQAISVPGTVTINVVDSFYQNSRNRFDVNDDGTVAPIDVLQVINDLRRSGIRPLPPTDFNSPPYVDVDGSRSVEPIDVLQVINEIARRSRGLSGEGESIQLDLMDSSNAKEPIVAMQDLSSIPDFATSVSNRKRIQQTDLVFVGDFDYFSGE